MITPPVSTRIGDRTDLRFFSQNISLGDNISFDSDVRIVVPASGHLSIGNNVKIGKGSVLNCGGRVFIGNDVSFYGYCYVQSSRWIWVDAKKTYEFFDLTIEDFSVIAPHTSISGNVTVPRGYRGQPGEVLGEW
ncbi:MAG: hypothetical protein ABJF50_24680 [Paracoccaceae bacterium]